MTTSTSGVTSTPVSVASNSSAGAAGGSVINVSSLVSQLVAAAQAPQESIIASQTSAVTTEISAIGSLQSALSTFQSSLTPLATPGAFNALTATSSSSSVLSASADSSAVPGSYSVSVTNLASAQQLLSNAVAGGGSATVGTGSLSLSLGATSFNVTIDSSNDTLDGIAAAINSASGNPGISAAVITGSDGAHLVLSSTLTGAANTIQVTETDSGTGLSSLTYGSGNTGHYTQQGAGAKDASFSIAGVSYTSASNTVSDALTGVTINLLGATNGTPATLTIASDTSTIESNVQGFVAGYNTLHAALASLGGYDASSGQAGALQGNPLLTNIQNQLQRALFSIVGNGTYSSLASIGITANSDGSLSVNNTTLQNALSSNFTAVSQLLAGSNGIVSNLNSELTAQLASGGPVPSTIQTLKSQENSLTRQSNQLSAQMAQLTQSLTEQYSALNALLSSMQTTSSYLSQQFATLPTVQGTPNA
jgi:flagellar hook-associated protein 2